MKSNRNRTTPDSKRKKIPVPHSASAHLMLPPPLHEETPDGTVAPGAGEQDRQVITEVNAQADQSTVPGLEAKRATMVASRPGIPGYTIKSKLGHGGMGTVFLATDDKLGREVAVKVVKRQVSSQPKLIERFASEVKAVASLNHPNIAQLYEADLFAEQPYYVMEFVDGDTLEDSLVDAPPSPERAAKMARTLADAMSFCHGKGIIHRDLKPSNVLLDREGNPKVADFGLAKSLESDRDATKTGEILGTPGYMAPEQASGVVKTIGPRCDVYAIGAILYRMLTGRAPFYAPDPLKTVIMVLSDDPVAPRKLQSGIPVDLETICLKCLEKKPERRYLTAADLSDDIGRFLERKPIHARPVSVMERAGKWARRKPAIAALLAAAMLIIPATIAGLAYHSNRLNSALERTDLELAHTRKLANEGSELTTWTIEEHLQTLGGMTGTNEAQLALVTRIEEYLNASAPDMPREAKFLRRHGRAYVAIADIQGNPQRSNLGRSDLALENYDHALDIYNETLDLEPDDFITRKLRIACLLNKSDVLLFASGPEKSGAVLNEVAAEIKEIKKDPAADDNEILLLQIQLEQGYSAIDFAENNFEKAMERYDAIEGFYRRFSTDADTWKMEREQQKVWVARERAGVYLKLGDFAKSAGQLETVLDDAKSNYESDPGNPRLVDRYLALLITLGDLRFEQLLLEEAGENYEVAEKVGRAALDRDPKDMDSMDSMAVIYDRRGSVYQYLENPDEALRFGRKAVEIRRKMLADDPDNAAYRQSLWLDMTTMASSLMSRGELDEAEKLFLEQHQLLVEDTTNKEFSILAMAALAQCKSNLGLTCFLRWNNVACAADADPDLFPDEYDEYKEAERYFDEAIATYGELNAHTPLNRNDAAYLEDIKGMKAELIATAEKLEDAMNGDTDEDGDTEDDMF